MIFQCIFQRIFQRFVQRKLFSRSLKRHLKKVSVHLKSLVFCGFLSSIKAIQMQKTTTGWFGETNTSLIVLHLFSFGSTCTETSRRQQYNKINKQLQIAHSVLHPTLPDQGGSAAFLLHFDNQKNDAIAIQWILPLKRKLLKFKITVDKSWQVVHFQVWQVCFASMFLD